jgi:hypothetical protein
MDAAGSDLLRMTLINLKAEWRGYLDKGVELLFYALAWGRYTSRIGTAWRGRQCL